jgi:hypothetical protein
MKHLSAIRRRGRATRAGSSASRGVWDLAVKPDVADHLTADHVDFGTGGCGIWSSLKLIAVVIVAGLA